PIAVATINIAPIFMVRSSCCAQCAAARFGSAPPRPNRNASSHPASSDAQHPALRPLDDLRYLVGPIPAQRLGGRRESISPARALEEGAGCGRAVGRAAPPPLSGGADPPLQSMPTI